MATSKFLSDISVDGDLSVTGSYGLSASDIPSLAASKVTSGTFSTSRIPSLAASKITSGTFSTARIADNAITAAKLNVSGNGTSGQVLSSDGDGSFSWVSAGGTGTVTQVTVGSGLDISNQTTTPYITLDLSELTDMTAAVNTSQDELILLDNGAERRKLFSEIFGSNAYNSTTIPTNNNQLTNGAGFITGVAWNELSGDQGGVPISGFDNDAGYLSSVPSTFSATQITLGSGVVLKESTDRADLLSISSSTSGWGGLQVTNSANEAIGSFMVNGTGIGLYDDQQNEWILHYTENGAVKLYDNGSQKFNTSSTGITVTGEIVTTGGNSTNWNTAYGWGDHSSEGYLTAHPSISAASSVNNSGRTYIQDITVDSNGHVTGITSATETVTNTNTQLSNEQVQDIVGAMVSGNTETNISVTYDDTNGKLNFASTDTNTQLSDAQVRSKISGTGLISYNSSTGVISTTANNYSLPAGSSSTRGGFKIGYAENGKNYPVEVSSEKMYVNVPWTDTDTNTTYSAGSGLDLSGTTFSIETDLRDGITRVGKDNSNYILFNTGSIDFYAGGVHVARLESDGDLHVKGDVIAASSIF